MQRSKTIGLMTQIFNKLSSKTFISKTCQTHTSSLPIYYCTSCFEEKRSVMCQHCYKDHECVNKTRGQVTQWVAKKQQLIAKCLNEIQKQFEAHKNVVQGCKIKLSGNQQKSINELNSSINMAISRGIESSTQKINEICVKPVTQGSMKVLSQNLLSQIKLEINGLTNDLSGITTIVQFCERKKKDILIKLEISSKQTLERITQFYKLTIQTVVKQVLQNILNDRSQEQKIERNNDYMQTNLKDKIQRLQKQNKTDNERVTELTEMITKLQQKFKLQSDNWRVKSDKYIQSIKDREKQVQIQKLKIKQFEERLSYYEKNQVESSDKDMKIKKLQEKCRIYEQQLQKNAKQGVATPEVAQKRIDLQAMATKLTQLSNQYQTIVLQCNNKDKRVMELTIELKKMQNNLQQKDQNIASLNQMIQTARSRSPVASSLTASNRKQFRSP